jgi:hypothetical protein
MYDKKSLGFKQNIDMLKKDELLFDLKSIFENHHLFGKQNSDEIAPIHKQRHAFINNRMNMVGKRKNEPRVQLYTSMIGALELKAFELRHGLHLHLNYPDEEEQFLQEINLSIEKTKESIRILYKNGNNNGKELYSKKRL